jgi:tripartite-type tricarboxylate transporter receptor subunit TctC
MRDLRLLSIAALPFVLAAASVSAQTYPVKPIRLVVPFGAGSTADIIGRVMAASLTKDLNQQVVVENKPGAGGTIGGAEVARAAPDGYTLVIGTVASHGVGPLTMKDVPYDPVKNFQAISLIANVPNLVAVHPSVPARTPAELVAFLKQNPGFTFTSAGPGTTAHLAGEFFGQKLDLKLVHVPYKAVGQAMTDVIGGQVKMIFYQLAGLKAHVDSGAVRPIAATSATRIPALPDMPTVAETLIPGFDFAPWFGLMAPVGTPRPIVDRLHGLVVKAVESAEMKKQFDAQGMESALKGPDEFQAFMRVDFERWRDVLQKAGMRPQ